MRETDLEEDIENMMLPPHERRCFYALLYFLLTIATGCGGEVANDDAVPDDSRIKQLTTLYAVSMNSQGGRPPADEAEFKEFVTKSGEELIKSAGVNAVDELFVSPRDNEPYVVLYGNEAARLINQGIVMHERTGVGGRRLVGYRGGFVNELDDAEFRKLVPP